MSAKLKFEHNGKSETKIKQKNEKYILGEVHENFKKEMIKRPHIVRKYGENHYYLDGAVT